MLTQTYIHKKIKHRDRNLTTCWYENWLKILWHIHALACYEAVKNNEVLIGVNLKGLLLR